MSVDVAQLENQIHLVVGDVDDPLVGEFHSFWVGELLAVVALHLAVFEGVV